MIQYFKFLTSLYKIKKMINIFFNVLYFEKRMFIIYVHILNIWRLRLMVPIRCLISVINQLNYNMTRVRGSWEGEGSWGRRRDMGADLRFGFLRLSTIKKCPHMLRSDHRELRQRALSKGVLMCIAAQNSFAQTSDLDS